MTTIPSLLPDDSPAAYNRIADAAYRRAFERIGDVTEFGRMFDPDRASMTFMRHAFQWLGCEPLWGASTGAGIVGTNALGVAPQYLFSLGGRLYGGGPDATLYEFSVRDGSARTMGTLTGTGAAGEATGAAVTRGTPYTIAIDAGSVYLNRIDIDTLTATRIGRVSGGRQVSIVSDGSTLWQISRANLFAIDTATAALSLARSVGGIAIGAGALARRPPATAYFGGQIYAMYTPATGIWRFDPAQGDAAKLPLAPMYDCAETLAEHIYAFTGSTLYRIHPETGGHDDYFDLAYHRRVLARGEWWIRRIGTKAARDRYMTDILGISYTSTVRRSPAGRPLGVTFTLRANDAKAATLLATPSALDQLTRRSLPYLLADRLAIDGIQTIVPLTSDLIFNIAPLQPMRFVDATR